MAAAGNGLLRETTIEQVTWQDGSVRRYHYEEPGYVEFPAPRLTLLTGITDETGARTAHYRYTGGIGNISSVTTSLAGDVNRYLIQSGDTLARVYGPLDSMTTIEREWAPGGLRVVSQSECAVQGFPCRAVSFNYDANGNIAERIDSRGTRSGYTYDPVRNLELRRTEGEGTSAARTVLTTWHPAWPVPTEIREHAGGVGSGGVPTGALLKRTVFTYDSSGNLTRRDEIDTVSTPTTRTWQWTYTTSGRVLTETDPNNRVTAYTYHSDTDPTIGRRGNLATVTNPSGHVTQYTTYDGNGRPTTIVDPNGVTRTLTYHARGWLTSIADSIAGTTRTTTIAYRANGRVHRITQPDGSFLQFGYDAAQRLTSVTDNLGNTVTYTLDNAGNRTDEQFRDSSNTLRQRVTRVFDTLSRLQSVTGALQ